MGHSIEFEVWRERQREMLREADERRLVREVRRAHRGEGRIVVDLVSGFVLGVGKLIGWPGREADVHSVVSGAPEEPVGSLRQHGEC